MLPFVLRLTKQQLFHWRHFVTLSIVAFASLVTTKNRTKRKSHPSWKRFSWSLQRMETRQIYSGAGCLYLDYLVPAYFVEGKIARRVFVVNSKHQLFRINRRFRHAVVLQRKKGCQLTRVKGDHSLCLVGMQKLVRLRLILVDAWIFVARLPQRLCAYDKGLSVEPPFALTR